MNQRKSSMIRRWALESLNSMIINTEGQSPRPKLKMYTVMMNTRTSIQVFIQIPTLLLLDKRSKPFRSKKDWQEAKYWQ